VRKRRQAGAGAGAALLLLASLIPGTSEAQAADAPPLVLEHLTVADGLPQATVMAVLQDSQGFVWIGTEDGLVRFDGRELHRYARTRAEEGSLAGNYIWDIAEDARGDLWIATKEGGLARWSRSADKFTVYRHDPGNPGSLASDTIRAVAIDARGRVWAATSGAGVDILDPASGRIEHLRHDKTKPGSLSSDNVFSLTVTRSRAIWIGTEAGLDRFDQDGTKRVYRGLISSVVEDRAGTLWVGTFDGGLARLDADGKVLATYRHDPQRAGSLLSDEVRAILEDSAGNLWVGTAEGLDLLDRVSGEFKHYRHDPADLDSLRDSLVMSLYQDPGGLVWIGTRSGGVSRWNPRGWELGGYRAEWLGNEPVNSFADAPDNQVWVSSLAAGLVKFDPATGKATPIDEVLGRKNALGGARVMPLHRDRHGTLWIGTMWHGLKKLSPEGTVESIPVKPGDPRAVSAPGIVTVVEARDGRMWIGTFGGGANILDPGTGRVRQLAFGSAPGAVSTADVTALAEDPSGNFWIGTDGGGLNLASADGTVIKVFRHDPKDAASLPSNSVYAIVVDAKQRVWLATNAGGLVRLVGSAASPDTIRFEAITRAEGLSSDTLYGVVPDVAGRLWLSGNAGLMRYDPETGAVKTFHREHGLQGEEFSFGAFFRLRDGRLCFGGLGGFNIFDPQGLTENRQPPRLALTRVEVLGVPAAGPTPFWLRDRIYLDYRGSIVSLDFGVLDFNSPKHNRIEYRMPGLTDHWIDPGPQRRITLTNLDAGDHVLEVRATNADSVTSPSPLTLSIHRDPAPWRSNAAYALYAAIILGLVLYRVHRQRRKFREMQLARERLESEVQLRTKELRESNRQLEEAARAKSDFLDRMSHELRTPMNGVVGMTELLSRTALSATQTHLTKTIRSSARILLQIVNDLLDLSKIRAGKVALESLPIDLGQVLEECTSLFAGAAESKGIELIVCPPARVERTLIGDPLRVRQILMNLVGNAVKFTSKGEVVVRADVESVVDGKALVRIQVTDTGIGMDAAAISRIFEPFSQADETTTRKFGGTGLGLAICRELADLMGARITVDSKPQIGSTFCLALPLVAGDGMQPSASMSQGRSVRILTRRPSLEEALSRHVATLGLKATAGAVAAAPTAAPMGEDEYIVVLDASTHPDELKALLAGPEKARASLVVLATSAEAEALGLRVLLNEKAIVLKPVHRIAFHEALAIVAGVQFGGSSDGSGESAGESLRGHVLLVEDDSVNAAVAEGYLAALGCTSVWVKNGADAIARSAGERFDLVLMDLNMPDMDGFAATALIRQREGQALRARRTPIVALTAHDAVNYRDKVLMADMDDILSKPYSLEDCSRLLRRWLPVGAREPAAASQPMAHLAVAEQPGAQVVQFAPQLTTIDAAAVSALRKLRGGSQTDLYSRLVDLYRSASAESLSQLKAAVEQNDLAAAASICHKFAASAANVGALAYSKRVRELEKLCIASDIQQVRDLHETLQAAHPTLLDAMLGLTLRATA
jgi:signal transduction histidine kinase/ligand-binding sensor domain-containing protein/CheY-like chemotaxis protein/HPt (histidine-containing phosphotransfer) domain-containing protein